MPITGYNTIYQWEQTTIMYNMDADDKHNVEQKKTE